MHGGWGKHDADTAEDCDWLTHACYSLSKLDRSTILNKSKEEERPDFVLVRGSLPLLLPTILLNKRLTGLHFSSK